MTSIKSGFILSANQRHISIFVVELSIELNLTEPALINVKIMAIDIDNCVRVLRKSNHNDAVTTIFMY